MINMQKNQDKVNSELLEREVAKSEYQNIEEYVRSHFKPIQRQIPNVIGKNYNSPD
jgi:replication initiation and membrane attachment protein DnaB